MDQLSFPKIEDDIVATQIRRELSHLKQQQVRLQEALESFEHHDLSAGEARDVLILIQRFPRKFKKPNPSKS